MVTKTFLKPTYLPTYQPTYLTVVTIVKIVTVVKVVKVVKVVTVFLERFEELFLNLILVELKFLKVFGFWLSSSIYLGKCLSQSRKRYLIIFGIRQPA